MFFCSIIIITSIFNSSKNFNKLDKASKRSLRRNKQIFIILMTTNSLFICLVSPLVFLNATNNIIENSISTTVAYICSYSNHGWVLVEFEGFKISNKCIKIKTFNYILRLNFVFYGISCQAYRNELLDLLSRTKKFVCSCVMETDRSYRIVRVLQTTDLKNRQKSRKTGIVEQVSLRDLNSEPKKNNFKSRDKL